MSQPTHPLLRRQLKRARIGDGSSMPTEAGWRAFLEHVEQAYLEGDQDRYTLERSLSISSREMQQLYEDLRRSSESQLAAERDSLEKSLAITRATQEVAPAGILVVDKER